MISNLLSLPFRKATSQILSIAIRQYISIKYNQHPDMFREDFEAIDTLREQAVHVLEPHVSGLKKIMAYTSQLAWIARKFPNDLGVNFTWYPAFGYNKEKPVSLDNLKFEQASILYNLTALYSQLAFSYDQNTTEGLKSACKYLCLAAGVIGYIQECIISEMQINPPDGLDNSTLEYLRNLLLAQAQECFWRKAVIDGYRDSSIAKLAAKTSDLYGIAADWSVKSETISSEWIHFTKAKHHHFAAAAQYRQACFCLDKKRYGEEVARLRDSVASAKEGLKEAKYLSKFVLEDLNGLKIKASEDLKRAEKDNDMIYLCPVPPKTELKPLERAVMAIPNVPLEVSEPLSFLGSNGEFGQRLFAKLVPFAVHVAASIFEQRLDRIVNKSIITPLEDLTTKIHSTLSSLSLPGSLQVLEKPLGLTPTLISHVREIRQTDAIVRLQRSFVDISSLARSADSTYAEARSHLILEHAENERLKAKYGTDRWNRSDSSLAVPKLYRQLNEIDGYLKTAANSDRLIYEKFQGCSDMLCILSSSDSEICNFVPSVRRIAMSPKLKEQVSILRNILNELNRLESSRRKNIESLQEKAKKDDINPSILVEAARLESSYPAQSLAPADFEDFLEERLSKYDSYILAVKNEEEEQSKQLEQLGRCHREFIKARNEDGAADKEREKTLQELEDAYFQYKEIVSSLESGRKFYNDLARMVGKFRDEAKAWAAERSEECVRIERELNLGQVSSIPIAQPQTKEELEIQTDFNTLRIQPKHISSHSRHTSEEPQTSKTPKICAQIQQDGPVIAVWDPSLGINFSGPEVDAKSGTNSVKLGLGDFSLLEDDGGGSRATADNMNREKTAQSAGIHTLSTNTNKSGNNRTWDPQQGLRFR